METSKYKSGDQLSSNSILIWRIIQSALWLIGAGIFFCLIFYPPIGINLFWNILIPVAPALLVIATGIWRNICPLATMSLFPKHVVNRKRRKLSISTQGKLNLIGILALYLIVPLRHALFNTSGLSTAILLVSVSIFAVAIGSVFEWKSAWCSGLCPIHSVEKLYGTKVLLSVPNAHCHQCMNCVVPCSDSTPGIHPNSAKKTIYHKIGGLLMIGGFPGLVWGWFHVPDHTSLTSFTQVLEIYKLPFAGSLITIVLYWLLSQLIDKKQEAKLVGIFAASAVACYYWYRLPALFGFGAFNNDGMLLDLSPVIPAWTMSITIMITSIFFFWWIVFRKQENKSWLIRPQYAPGQKRHL